jgi:hypothetical protein
MRCAVRTFGHDKYRYCMICNPGRSDYDVHGANPKSARLPPTVAKPGISLSTRVIIKHNNPSVTVGWI